MATDLNIARTEIKRHLKLSSHSLRRLSIAIGLKGHGSISRFLSKKGTLSTSAILKLSKELGIEGKAYERILNSLLPEELSNVKSAPYSLADSVEAKESYPQLRLLRFFYNPKIPILYDTLKIVENGSIADLKSAFHSKVKWSAKELEEALKSLISMGLASFKNDQYSIVKPIKDIVIPSKYSNESGRRLNRNSLSNCIQFLDEPHETRMMRSIVTSLKLPLSGRAMDRLKPLVMKFQDEILALQGEEDDAVVEVFVSAIEVAKRKNNAP